MEAWGALRPGWRRHIGWAWTGLGFFWAVMAVSWAGAEQWGNAAADAVIAAACLAVGALLRRST